jgi:lipoate-protein ligase A
MSNRGRVLISTLDSIFPNLAAEEALVADHIFSRSSLFFWRNSPAVVIGRHQNPWKECNLSKLEDENISLSRRYSGGGAVYHDKGCTIFTFIAPISGQVSATSIIDSNFDVLISGLKRLGVDVSRRGRNDLVVGDRKISGSAFKQTSDMLVHHGTILVDTNMSKLSTLLTPSKLKLQSKGISSVRARVSNLTEFNPSVCHQSVTEAITSQYCPNSIPEVIDDVVQASPVYQRHLTQLKDWSWRYGTTPEFSHHIETRIDNIGCFDIHYHFTSGKISKIRIFSDILYPDLIEAIEAKLINTDYSIDEIARRMNELIESEAMPEKRAVLSEFKQWLLYELSL